MRNILRIVITMMAVVTILLLSPAECSAKEVKKLPAPEMKKVKVYYDYNPADPVQVGVTQNKTVRWKAVKGADGYQVSYRKVGNSKWKTKDYSGSYIVRYGKVYSDGRIIKTDCYTKNTYKTMIVTHYTEYRVRAYEIVNGKKVYGSYSKTVRPERSWNAETLKADLEEYIEKMGPVVTDYTTDDNGNPVKTNLDNSSWLVDWPRGIAYELDYKTALEYAQKLVMQYFKKVENLGWTPYEGEWTVYMDTKTYGNSAGLYLLK